MRRTAFFTFLALSLLAVAAARPEAQSRGKHITDITEKHKHIDSVRPAQRILGAAQRGLRGHDASELAVLNAMRALARPDVRLKEDPFVHGRMDLPPLGTLAGDSSALPDTWVLLRLLALLRAGYPNDPALSREVFAWLHSGRPGARHEWSDASLELLTLEAFCARGDDVTLAPLIELAESRATAIASARIWTIEAPEAPDAHTVVNQLHFLIARRVALANNWLQETESAAPDIAARLTAAVNAVANDAPLWPGIGSEIDAQAGRNLMLVAAVLGLAAADRALTSTQRRDAEAALRKLSRRLPKNAEVHNGWRFFKGDAMALLPLAGADFRAGDFAKAAASLSLPTPRLAFATPRPHNNHFAAGLRWLLCRSLGDAGMGRGELDLEERDLAAVLCMGLIGATGGLLAQGRKPQPASEAAVRFESLELLDLDDYFDHMVKTDLAIESASGWLLKQQRPDGKFFGQYLDVLGGHALALHALLDAGVPRTNPQIRKAWATFIRMIERDLPNAGRNGRDGTNAHGPHNYSMSIALMTFQSYYEHEVRESGMYEATTCEAYFAARQRIWSKIPESEQKLIAEISWRLSNADGFGWSYQLPEPKSPIPAPITVPPAPGNAKPITGERKDLPREVSDEIARRRREGKYPARPAEPPQGERHGDSSNSQYSVLGIKAGMTLGAPMDFKTLAWEAERLIQGVAKYGYAERPVDVTLNLTLDKLDQRARDGYAPDDPNRSRLRATLQPFEIVGWSYYAHGANTWGRQENDIIGHEADGTPRYRWPYSVAMTAAGISSLAIIRDALMVAPIYDPELIGRIDDRIAGGLFGLGQRYPYNRDMFKIDVRQTDAWVGGREGMGMLYDMYSCERAGVLTRQVYFGRVEWYRDGADLLMKEQAADGSWKAINTHLCNTSWAILFLKRSAPYLATRQPSPRNPTTGK